MVRVKILWEAMTANVLIFLRFLFDFGQPFWDLFRRLTTNMSMPTALGTVLRYQYDCWPRHGWQQRKWDTGHCPHSNVELKQSGVIQFRNIVAELVRMQSSRSDTF